MFLPLKSKFPSEVMATLARSWFHVHGLPEFILSDRGKEFLGVLTVVCRMLDIKQVKTTPYHPRTNGLCESQHKVLTYELRIRSVRPSAPQWTELITEIAFAHNITVWDAMGGVSPFQMVFGRKPRLSAKDVYFPSHDRPKPVPEGHKAREYVQRLQNSLEGLRFDALDKAIEDKEDLRVRHDNNRAGASASSRVKYKVGDIVCISTPSPLLKKVTYQWSEPCFVVSKVGVNTCEVRDLTAEEGKILVSRMNRQGCSTMSTKVINRKSMSPYRVSPEFFVGAQIAKRFRAEDGSTVGWKWYLDTVEAVVAEEEQLRWHVVYADFFGEDMSAGTLANHLAYHPLLDTCGDLDVPEAGSFVWFAEAQQPRLGRVESVDPTNPRPLTVLLFTPQANARNLSQARFAPARDEDDQHLLMSLTLHQVKLRFPRLTSRGYLSTSDRRKLQTCLQI